MTYLHFDLNCQILNLELEPIAYPLCDLMTFGKRYFDHKVYITHPIVLAGIMQSIMLKAMPA